MPDAPPPRRRLEIVPVGGFRVEWLGSVLPRLDERLGTVSSPGAPLDVEPGWKSGGRLRSTPVLDALLARAGAEGGGRWRLAVAGELRSEEGARVFGEAAVGGGCAVAGVGLPDDAKRSEQSIWELRALKVCVHEAAHAAGLAHCADPACVMYPSRDIDDTDRKAPDFCARCAADYSHATLDAPRS